jgi:TRAP-type C4-dicarboxylate transport system permease small subunit
MYLAVLIWFKRVESIVATIAYGIVATLLMADVIGRELFSSSFLGTQQVAVYGAIIAGFLGLTLATSDNGHLRPGFMDFLFRKHEQIVTRISDLVSAAFFWASAYIAWTFVSISMESGDKAPVLYFVLWPLQLVIPYAFASSGLKHLIFAIRPELKNTDTEKVD